MSVSKLQEKSTSKTPRIITQSNHSQWLNYLADEVESLKYSFNQQNKNIELENIISSKSKPAPIPKIFPIDKNEIEINYNVEALIKNMSLICSAEDECEQIQYATIFISYMHKLLPLLNKPIDEYKRGVCLNLINLVKLFCDQMFTQSQKEALTYVVLELKQREISKDMFIEYDKKLVQCDLDIFSKF